MKANELRIGNLVRPVVGELEHIAEIKSISNTAWVEFIDDNYEEYLSTSLELDYKNPEPKEITVNVGFKSNEQI